MRNRTNQQANTQEEQEAPAEPSRPSYIARLEIEILEKDSSEVYPVTVYLDEDEVGVMGYGSKAVYELSLAEGSHTLKLESQDSIYVFGTATSFKSNKTPALGKDEVKISSSTYDLLYENRKQTVS